MKKIIIWDGDGVFQADDSRVILWAEFNRFNASNTVSMTEYIENNADELKEKYLNWVYDLGNLECSGKTLADFFVEYLGINYWWMLPIAEKCNFYKSPFIRDAIGVLALDGLIKDKVDLLCVLSPNITLINSLSNWAAERSIPFKFEKLSSGQFKTINLIKNIYSKIPVHFLAAAWLIKYLWLRWPLKGVGLDGWKKSKAKITFFSYLFGFNLSEENVENPYWGYLPKLIKNTEIKTRWLHIYVKDAQLSTAAKAKELIGRMNMEGDGLQCHVTLDSFLKASIVMAAIKRWVKLVMLSKKINYYFMPKKMRNPSLWPLFAHEWKGGVAGVHAIKALLHYGLIESALDGISKQDQGIYLQENQAWEFGLLSIWKKLGHKVIIGFPHTVIRYWDLRYFFDRRSYKCASKSSIPKSDFVASSGPAATKEFLAGGFPADSLLEVEALRYLHLSNLDHTPPRLSDANRIRLLVLGDYEVEATLRLMNILAQATFSCEKKVEITLKPHPNNILKKSDFIPMDFVIKINPIKELLPKYDLVYTGAITSAVIDAYMYGLPIISLNNPKTLNLSPLRGNPKAIFVSNTQELSDAITSVHKRRYALPEDIFFNLNPNLINWLSILGDKVKYQ